jgi:hypothetical protein
MEGAQIRKYAKNEEKLQRQKAFSGNRFWKNQKKTRL